MLDSDPIIAERLAPAVSDLAAARRRGMTRKPLIRTSCVKLDWESPRDRLNYECELPTDWFEADIWIKSPFKGERCVGYLEKFLDRTGRVELYRLTVETPTEDNSRGSGKILVNDETFNPSNYDTAWSCLAAVKRRVVEALEQWIRQS